MDSLTSTLRAISDPTRRTILDLLRTGRRSVNDLAEQFEMSRPAVSKHLGILREAGLVTSHRKGRQQIYELDAGPLAPASEWLDGHRQRSKRADRPRPAARKASRPASGRDDWRSW